MLRAYLFAALLLGAGLMFGGAIEETTPVGLVEDASACESPEKGCGSCSVRFGDPQEGKLVYIDCHN